MITEALGRASRRRIARAGVVVVVLGSVGALAGPAMAASGWTAYVSSGTGDTVAQINTATDMTIGLAIPAGVFPNSVAVAPDGRIAYVADAGNAVTPINLVTNTPGSAVTVGGRPEDVAITPDGTTAYVTSEAGNFVTPINLATDTPGVAVAVGKGPEGIAISPDGRTAYVANSLSGTVTPINLATNAAETAIPVGDAPSSIAITPDGRTAYVANFSDNTVTPIDLASNTPGTAIPVGVTPAAVAITPDGKTAYVSDYYGNTVTPIDTATNSPGTPLSVTAPGSIAITPDGRTAYVIDSLNSGTVTPIDLATNTPGPAIAVGAFPSGVVVAPDQAPAAVFSTTPAAAGQSTTLDASGSSSPVGAIASYQWDFGDGHAQTTPTAMIAHAYVHPGVYTARLTVTNTAGTSTGEVFTGQTVSNHGGPQATTTRTVTIAAAEPPAPPNPPGPPTIARLTRLTIAPRSVDLAGRRVQGHCQPPSSRNRRHPRCRRAIQLRLTWGVTAPSTLTIHIAKEHPGRKTGKRCVAPSRHNRHHPGCTRLSSLRGQITKTTPAGTHSLTLTARFAGHQLTPGTYQLTATPHGGTPRIITFTISP
jgi:YVTN family beta-propeller protein